ncbi:MAG: hypothetical protein R3E63_07445 [Pseudomonadales bacterium]
MDDRSKRLTRAGIHNTAKVCSQHSSGDCLYLDRTTRLLGAIRNHQSRLPGFLRIARIIPELAAVKNPNNALGVIGWCCWAFQGKSPAQRWLPITNNCRLCVAWSRW